MTDALIHSVLVVSYGFVILESSWRPQRKAVDPPNMSRKDVPLGISSEPASHIIIVIRFLAQHKLRHLDCLP